MYRNCKSRSCSFNILSLMKQPNRAAWKKILPKIPNILKRIFTWIHINKPAKLLKVTLRVRFFRNPAYNIIIYSLHYQQFNLAGCFSHKQLGIFNHKCSNTLTNSHMKSFKGTKKLELNLNIEFGRAVLSTISVSRRSEVMHAQKVGTEVIPFYLVIKSQLKKSSYKGGTKIVPSRLSYKQPPRKICQSRETPSGTVRLDRSFDYNISYLLLHYLLLWWYQISIVC